MALRLYNSLTKHEEDFTPLSGNVVTMYTCGPTVYGRPHIGNYASFLMADLLQRWLQAGHKFDVHLVKNITDVGHLLHDADTGDDKIQKEAEKQKRHPLEIAKMYTEQYLSDEKLLNFLEPFARPRASETIPEMIDIIKELLKKGNAYETDDGIYFSVQTFPHYGALSGNTLDKLDAGARIAVDEKKKHPADFALWKKCVGGNSHHILRWEFATGAVSHTSGDDPLSGFPGWHIECSAMSTKHLQTKTIDIHTGGEDNIFPHHECEVAQSESAFGVPFVRMWVHRRRIDIAADRGANDAQVEKMSKSLGNVFLLQDIIDAGFHPLDLRYFLLSVHYRTRLKFSWKGMEDSKKARRKILQWMYPEEARQSSPDAKDGKKFADAIKKSIHDFTDAMDSDLNVSGALAIIFDTITLTNKQTQCTQQGIETLGEFINLIRETFGCFEAEKALIPAEIQALVDARAAAKKNKDFKESDRLRDEITSRGFDLLDTPKGQVVRPKQ